MTRTVTRRELAVAIAGASPLLAQTPPAAAQTPDELLKAAKEQVQRNSEQLAKIEVPMALEPSFVFRP